MQEGITRKRDGLPQEKSSMGSPGFAALGARSTAAQSDLMLVRPDCLSNDRIACPVWAWLIKT